MALNHTLTNEETATLKRKAKNILSICRTNLLSTYPFIGSIALRMEITPIRDIRVRTACTDGNTIYFDIAFLSSLNANEQLFVLAHEVWHAVLMHLVRRQNRDVDLFNIAADKEVDYMLKQDGFTPPKDLIFPTEEEEGKCAEEIYEMMQKKQPKSNKSSGGSSSKNGNNKNGNKSSSPSSSKSLSGQFDKHIYDSDINDNDGQTAESMSITDKYGQVGFDNEYRPAIDKDFADKMREAIISEAQRFEKINGQGSLPAHIKQVIKKFITPQIRWQEILAQYVTRCYNSGTRSWIPPNRRHVYNGIYLQSQQAQTLKAVLAIDTSGSTYTDRQIFLSELNSLINSFGIYELTIMCVDAEVASCHTYTQDDPLDIEHEGFEMVGGGGTSFIAPFDYMIDNQIQADIFIYLTDGYGDAPTTNPLAIPVLWVITKDGTEDFCDWGKKIRLKTSDSDYA